ncbi:hypothetical protein PAEPH01_0651 [Pancytospora epiphaga]|nr:hypothetical protein PAEPH01_0651 [Pancytospora epiphaga]
MKFYQNQANILLIIAFLFFKCFIIFTPMTMLRITHSLFILVIVAFSSFTISPYSSFLSGTDIFFLGRWSFAITWSLLLTIVTLILYFIKLINFKFINKVISTPLSSLIGLGLAVHTTLTVSQAIESTIGWHGIFSLSLLKPLFKRPRLMLILASLLKIFRKAGILFLLPCLAYVVPLIALFYVWTRVSARPSYLLIFITWIFYNGIIIFCYIKDGMVPCSGLNKAPSICTIASSVIMLCGEMLITFILQRIESKRRIRRIKNHINKNK